MSHQENATLPDAPPVETDDRMARQIALETEMTSAGIARTQAAVANAKAERREAGTPAGQRMLEAAVEPTRRAIEAYLEDARSGRPGPAAVASGLLEGLDPNVIAYITARVILDRITGANQLQTCAIFLASCVEDEARFQAVKSLPIVTPFSRPIPTPLGGPEWAYPRSA